MSNPKKSKRMKDKLLRLTSGSLRMLMLVAALALTCSASAVEWKTFETGVQNAYEAWKDVSYKYTAPSDGILRIYCQSSNVQVYSKADENGIVKGEYDSNNDWISNELSHFVSGTNTIDGVDYNRGYTETSVKAGVEYYILASSSMSSSKKYFYGVLETGTSKLEIKSMNFEEGKVFDITGYGQLNIEFNMKATADVDAYLTVGNYPAEADKEKGRVEVHSSTQTGQLSIVLKDTLNNWLSAGYFTGGETMTLKLTGIKAQADDNIVYGEDGSLTLTFLAPSKGHKLVKEILPSPLYSYYAKGDADGIVKMIFDTPVMSGSEQKATAALRMGYADLNDVYAETIGSDKISANGDTLFIDLTDKLRSYEAMGLTSKYGSFTFNVFNVVMADGTYASTEGAHVGSYTYTLKFEERNNGNVTAEFTPASGETLTDNLEVYFSDKSAYTFSGMRFSYQNVDTDKKYQVDVTEGITSASEGKNGITYTIPVPAAVKAGKNVRIEFIDLVSADGMDHSSMTDGVKFNPGNELTADLSASSQNINDGDVVTFATGSKYLVLTFDQNVYVNKVEGRRQVTVKDLTTGTYLTAKTPAYVSRKNLNEIKFCTNEGFKNTHKYQYTISEATVVDSQYVATSGQYGKYMPEIDITFTVNENKGNLDFIADPVEGSIVNSISTIKCTTDKTKDESTNWVGFNNSPDYTVWAVQINGTDTTKIQQAKLSAGENNDGFVITFDPAITTPGKYTILVNDSVYSLGTGFEAAPNEYKVTFDYTVIEAPTTDITVTADPADEAYLTSLKTITLTADDDTKLWCGTTPVTVYNRVERKSYEATMSMPSSIGTNKLVITLDDELTIDANEGDYTVSIPAGSFGDQTWYDNDALTGRTNEAISLFYTLGEAPVEVSYTADPADESTVESLSTITISIGDGTADYGQGSGKATFSCPANRINYEIEPEAIWPDSFDDPVYQYTITLPSTITEAGVYTLTIPDGLFLDANGDDVPGTTFTWTIEAGSTPAESLITSDPANGSTVASLKKLTLSVGDGTVDYAVGSGKITVTDPSGNEIFSGDADPIYPESFFDPAYQFELTLSQEYKTAGTYTITIPDGYFVDSNYESVAGTTITITVDPSTGIDGVAADEANVKAFTIGGVRVNAKTAKGIVIVNGKKVVKK